MKMDKNKIIINMLNILGKDITDLNDLNGTKIDRDKFKDKLVIESFKNMIPQLKQFYNSGKFNCLHQNSLEKQKQPAVCMLRQILKANNYKMAPKISSLGYDKTTGKKLINRYYLIEKF